MEYKHSRRALLGASAGILATGAMAAAANPAIASTSSVQPPKGQPSGGPNVIPADRIGLQVFTVRGLVGTPLSVPGTFEVLSDAGIREIELAGTYYDKTPSELRTIAESFGLRVASNHFGPRSSTAANPWATVEGRRQVFAEAKALGFPLVGTGSMLGIASEMTSEAFKRAADLFSEWGRHAVEEGMEGFFFHNHDNEFVIEDGKQIFDILLEYTDPRYVKFEMDLGWLAIAGEDPYEFLLKHQSRVPLFHIKNFKWDLNGNRVGRSTKNAGRRFRFVDLDKGELDYGHILSALQDLRAHRYFLEHDDAGNLELNPAGSPNSVWRGATSLSRLNTSGR